MKLNVRLYVTPYDTSTVENAFVKPVPFKEPGLQVPFDVSKS